MFCNNKYDKSKRQHTVFKYSVSFSERSDTASLICWQLKTGEVFKFSCSHLSEELAQGGSAHQ
jgi:hypothetical protein